MDKNSYMKEYMRVKRKEMSEDEKIDYRKRDAERKRVARKGKKAQRRDEMCPEDLSYLRARERKNQKNKRDRRTSEEKKSFKIHDSERKAKQRAAAKQKKKCKKEKRPYRILIDKKFEKLYLKELRNGRRIQQKIRNGKSPEERELDNIDSVKRTRNIRENWSEAEKEYAREQAWKGMTFLRRGGKRLREYCQRKRRPEHSKQAMWNSFLKKNPHCKDLVMKRVEILHEEVISYKQERGEFWNRRVKGTELEYTTFPEYEKGAYELLREKNIAELERLKQESGLFD